ncbi:hypothetical protein [Leeuwenhoekiella sp. W20_SRS_FM14]|uniref:hypothetical protein n=1 Tax=Leeuwenhoekiella sp. W20_SRS_FM14 TaxID=3240270 RepID=UPI003F97D5F1
MKTIKTFFALFIFAATFTSCDAVNDLLPDFELEDDFTADIDAVITEGSSSLDTNFNIDASTNADFQKYKENIKSVSIEGFTYSLSNVNAPEGTILNGTLSASGKSVTVTDLAIANGTTRTVTAAESEFFNALAADLKADGKASINLEGTVNNEAGSTFTVTVTPTIRFIFEAL